MGMGEWETGKEEGGLEAPSLCLVREEEHQGRLGGGGGVHDGERKAL